MSTTAAPTSRRDFQDPDSFADAVQNAHLRLTLQRGGHFRAKVTQARLPMVNLSLVEESLPRMALIETAPERIYVRPTLHEDSPSIADGQEELPGTIRLRHEASLSVEHTTGDTVRRNLSLPCEALQARTVLLLGRDLSAMLQGPLRMRPAPGDFTTLVALHHEAIGLARDAPHILAHPVAAESLDARIAEALLAAWDQATALPERAAQRRGNLLMSRVLRRIEEEPSAPLHLTALCEAAGCSAKTLEVLFRERLGQTPIRYLHSRRLRLAHHALLAADPRGVTVAAIALECGFWELGRFAGAYRAMFGETPSETLRHKRAVTMNFGPFTISA
ncbi:AraC family transcriptional regulator [Sediminicoccus sp. KRV36]|uniref:AraC family transcriptional regulator n=1 Tax=Sediminicoccus sp. KRV36 TaxID=3133721 RepID=UPI00200F442C|nr:AraC family transcriptional regulator [Sediminicoccus rosea]UPY38867.1 helix-turn-helix domain-containing protein [Sediminicoccus rosea]